MTNSSLTIRKTSYIFIFSKYNFFFNSEVLMSSSESPWAISGTVYILGKYYCKFILSSFNLVDNTLSWVCSKCRSIYVLNMELHQPRIFSWVNGYLQKCFTFQQHSIRKKSDETWGMKCKSFFYKVLFLCGGRVRTRNELQRMLQCKT